jgi:hypothetical protein
MADHSKKDTAQAQFAKALRAEDGKKAMSEYEAEAAAVRAKTAKLRLARDAAEQAAAAERPVVAKKKPAKKAKETSAKLAEFLEDQKNGGRNS